MSAPWSDEELSHLYAHVNDEEPLDALCALLPDRNRRAISVKLCRLREEAGIRVGPYPSNWQDDASIASQRLAQAIEAEFCRAG